MSDLQAIADRVEIEALRGEFTDAEMMDDYRVSHSSSSCYPASSAWALV